ncbi:DUF5714 domain-containing protein [Deltaproteobacteria bacterium OttesenSCG-928-M10]|nr:DUF5714 domain-containing protein [Deltaproteobacteria bacterium OttesenSCG-928-M10]
MIVYRTGCLICGQDLQYFEPAKILRCEICQGEFESGAACLDNHFVCDTCHSKAGYDGITRHARETGSREPIAVAREMMENPFINMHGPEHHYLVVAALLAAYKNAGGHVDLEKALSLARQRAQKVPGGICGLWGSCGAGIGAGIFVSIITAATPLSVDEWKLANKATSQCLDVISQHGGPRCCKRDTFLAILTVTEFVREKTGVEMEKPETVRCTFFGNNPSCKKGACTFYSLNGSD